jgi:MoxR-like ATPase
MSLFFKASCTEAPDPKPTLPPPLARGGDAKTYLADAGLVHAVNTALLLGRPLLVTGEPGTGKTQLATSVAWQLGLGEPLAFVAKSVSQGPELFYTFDAVAHFKARDADAIAARPIDFVRYNALGRAVVYANPPDAVKHLLPRGFEHPGQRRSVVLIDEVDKAPRDFPNDILTELEAMRFSIAEVGVELRAEPAWQPVVVITSNSERGLPDAFLRRCIYYDIPFPSAQQLDDILRAKLGQTYDREYARTALELFDELRRDSTRLAKKPSTAELIGWMTVMQLQQAAQSGGKAMRNPLLERRLALETLGVLIKSRDDLRNARPIVEAWVQRG